MVETAITITIMGVFLSVGMWIFQPVLDSWTLGSARSEAVGGANYALNRMVAEIAQVKDSQSVTTANANTLAFTDVNNNAVQYSLSGGNLLRNGDIFARGVNALSFTYRNVSNQTLATPLVSPSNTDIWRIFVRLDVQADSDVVSMESEIHPRNLSRF